MWRFCKNPKLELWSSKSTPAYISEEKQKHLKATGPLPPVLTAALFVSRAWKQHGIRQQKMCIDASIGHKKWHFDIFNNMDGPRVIMLSEISHRKTDTLVVTYMWNLRNKWIQQTHREQTSGYQWEVGRSKKGAELKRYKLLCVEQVKKKDTLRCRGKQSLFCIKFKCSVIYKQWITRYTWD